MIGLAFAFAMALGGSAPPEEPIRNVGEVRGHLVEWDGHIILVRGWISRCGDLECYLFSKPDPSSPSDVLTIGYVPEMEGQLVAHRDTEVILEARVTDECVSGCMDRGPQIVPIRIVRILTPARIGAREK